MKALLSPDHPLASAFLAIAASVFLVSYALPLLFAPLRWASLFRWQVPAEGQHLTVYFGRCLGGVAIAVIVGCFEAMPHPEQHRGVFDIIAAVGVVMVGIHAWGAIRRTQPWTETVEIGLYAALAALALLVRPGA